MQRMMPWCVPLVPVDCAHPALVLVPDPHVGRTWRVQLMPLVSLPVADSILGYVGATVTNSLRLLAKDTPLSIDRVQAARLYAGMLEVRSRPLEMQG